jgi:hypothetical protein
MESAAYVLGWFVWWVISLGSGVLTLAVAIRIATNQPIGRIMPWQAGAQTVLATWFLINDDLTKLHLIWLGPVVASAVALLRLSNLLIKTRETR